MSLWVGSMCEEREQRIIVEDSKMEITENIEEEEVEIKEKVQHISVVDSRMEITENMGEEKEVELEE